MIALLLGTEQLPFKRAVHRVLPLAADRDLVVQHGHTPPEEAGERVTWVSFMPYERVLALCNEASAIVCHAGVGTIMTARSVGKTPLVIPRLARFGEHVDDHQLQIASELARHNLVVYLDDDVDVRTALRLAAASHVSREPNESLRHAIAEAVGHVDKGIAQHAA
jgi:UDP-N-acetylglucosamine--N-acetylmuramyl-(pentapeptide) pyrophosphoryl-undecaprenol N-acetylglucosamine transferase